MKAENGIRLDKQIDNKIPDGSRSLAKKLIDEGKVKVNNKTVTKHSFKLTDKDKVSLNFKFKDFKANTITMPIIYEDDFCLVLNKPSGIITHAKGVYSTETSVASFIRDKISPNLVGNRAGIIHRLDRGTSGLIIVAKTEEARKYLAQQFAKRQVKKNYYCIISGTLDPLAAKINMPIERNPKKPSTFRPGANGKEAITFYKVIVSNHKYSLIELSPLTGRTHQIRVHLKAINHPIVGDAVYGGEKADRLMLHAASLKIKLKEKGIVTFSTALPREFSKFVKMPKDIENG